MTFRNLIYMAFLVFGNSCNANIEPAFETEVKIQIKDENNLPVENAEVVLLFTHFDSRKTKRHEIRTDLNGVVEVSEKVVSVLMVTVRKEGFYPIRIDRALIRMDVDHKKIKNFELPLVMRRVISPASLYARKIATPIPVTEKTIGFDLEVGDWVKPHGRGNSTDILFSFEAKMEGYKGNMTYEEMVEEITMAHRIRPSAKVAYFDGIEKNYGDIDRSSYKEAIGIKAGKWSGILKVSFPSIEEGIIIVDNEYTPYSTMKMPHVAFEEGYAASYEIKANTFTPEASGSGNGYFIRTRVKLDGKGEITSANYAKITSPIRFDPRGRVEFTYVFNPAPKDRNLEFDPEKNRFVDLHWEEIVSEP